MISVIVSHFHSYLTFLFHPEVISVRNFNVFFRIFWRTWNKIWKLWCHVARWSRIQNPIGQLQTFTNISTKTFVITRHMWHRCIYLLVAIFSPLLYAQLSFSLKRTCFRRFSLSFGGFRHFLISWSSDPHLKHFRGVRYVCLLSESPAVWAFSFSCMILFLNKLQSDYCPQKKCTLSEHCLFFHYFHHNLSSFLYLNN